MLQRERLDDRMGRRFRRPRGDAHLRALHRARLRHPLPAQPSRPSTCSPTPANPDVVLGVDFLASEGYGEIIGGGQRIHDLALLEQRIEEHNLPREAYEWYLDLRKYGIVPHSGFGLGIERTVAWICGIKHIRETIPFPRLLYRIYP